MIRLCDIIKFTDEQYTKAKIKFNIHNHYDDPIELYKTNPDLINKEWLYWRNKNRYFNEGQIAICLVRMRDPDYWLLTTIDTVDKELNVVDGINYTGTPFEEYQSFYGRIVIKFHKTFQTQGVNYSTVADALEVTQILPDTFDDDHFPGYEKVKLNYSRLKAILDRGKSDWINALENQKAVYLITDSSNGKLYVGSATGERGMLLQRWRSYAENGHGGNVELLKIVKENGLDYVKKNFQYAILENYNARVDDSVILQRESWWKEVLKSREFGYNDN